MVLRCKGFEVTDKGCCGVGRNNGQITCLPLQQPCQDRQKHLFWDAFHPTEVANINFAKTSYSSQTKSVVKQEMGNIGKDVTEPLSHQETSKAWEKKPKSYIIFKDLLKSIFLFFPLFESGIIGRQSKKRHSFAPQDFFWSV